jgi:phosphate:Na+ symporter
MLRKIFLPSIFIVLSWGFWISPDFKIISAGVAIFLFGMLSLENILYKVTDERWKSASFGIVLPAFKKHLLCR